MKSKCCDNKSICVPVTITIEPPKPKILAPSAEDYDCDLCKELFILLDCVLSNKTNNIFKNSEFIANPILEEFFECLFDSDLLWIIRRSQDSTIYLTDKGYRYYHDLKSRYLDSCSSLIRTWFSIKGGEKVSLKPSNIRRDIRVLRNLRFLKIEDDRIEFLNRSEEYFVRRLHKVFDKNTEISNLIKFLADNDGNVTASDLTDYQLRLLHNLMYKYQIALCNNEKGIHLNPNGIHVANMLKYALDNPKI